MCSVVRCKFYWFLPRPFLSFTSLLRGEGGRSVSFPKETLYWVWKLFLFSATTTRRKPSLGNWSSFFTSSWVQSRGIAFRREIKVPVCVFPCCSSWHWLLDWVKTGRSFIWTLKPIPAYMCRSHTLQSPGIPSIIWDSICYEWPKDHLSCPQRVHNTVKSMLANTSRKHDSEKWYSTDQDTIEIQKMGDESSLNQGHEGKMGISYN